MPNVVTVVRVLVSSPSDVQAEREAVPRVVDELNSTVAPQLNVRLEVMDWRQLPSHVADRPQAVINRWLAEYEVYIGIMSRRFGTPTGAAASGTEEEFRLAYASWQENGTPHIMFYFRSPEEHVAGRKPIQYSRVVAFRHELQQIGLIKSYNTLKEFETVVRCDLARLLRLRSPVWTKSAGIGSPLDRSILDGPLEFINSLITDLLRLRAPRKRFVTKETRETLLRMYFAMKDLRDLFVPFRDSLAQALRNKNDGNLSNASDLLQDVSKSISGLTKMYLAAMHGGRTAYFLGVAREDLGDGLASIIATEVPLVEVWSRVLTHAVHDGLDFKPEGPKKNVEGIAVPEFPEGCFKPRRLGRMEKMPPELQPRTRLLKREDLEAELVRMSQVRKEYDLLIEQFGEFVRRIIAVDDLIDSTLAEPSHEDSQDSPRCKRNLEESDGQLKDDNAEGA